MNQVSQVSQEVQDSKEALEHLVCQVYQEDPVPKVILAFQDSKVLLVTPVQRVWMVGPVPQVSLVLLADQESQGAQEHQVCLERKVRQVEMEFQDQLGSKENQAFLDLVVLVLLGFQVYRVQREIQVFQDLLVVLVSPALKERLVSLATLVLQATADLLALQVCLCKAPKDSKDPLDPLEEQVHPAQRVHVDPQEAAALKERRVSQELLVSQASLDRKEREVFQDSRVPLVFLVVLV